MKGAANYYFGTAKICTRI